MANLRTNKLVGIGSTDAGVVFDGPIKINTQNSMYFPTGTTTQRGRGRGVLSGGYDPAYSAIIQYIQIQSSGNSIEFGDLTLARSEMGNSSSSTRGLNGGGWTDSASNIIDYITIATTGNATDFGDAVNKHRNLGALSDSHGGLS